MSCKECHGSPNVTTPVSDLPEQKKLFTAPLSRSSASPQVMDVTPANAALLTANRPMASIAAVWPC